MATRYTAIRGLQIKDATLTPDKLKTTNTPANGQFLAYQDGDFVWLDPDVYGVMDDDVICNEVPTGDIDGSNTVFTLANVPVVGTVQVYLNGMLQAPGSGKDYVISGNQITFTVPPDVDDYVLCSYVKE